LASKAVAARNAPARFYKSDPTAPKHSPELSWGGPTNGSGGNRPRSAIRNGTPQLTGDADPLDQWQRTRNPALVLTVA